jgi:subtilisin family serine protease
MKNFIIFLIFILYMPSLSEELIPEYYANKVVIKIKTNSVESLSNETISVLNTLLGQYEHRTFLHPALIAQYNLRYNDNLMSLGGGSNVSSTIHRILVFEYTSAIDPMIAAKKISNLSEIEYAEPMFIRKFADLPNDSLLFEQYMLPLIGAIPAWEIMDTTDSDTIVVAVVDTGVDYLHEDLLGTLYINPGEDGLDDEGNDKRTNGIDDDENGFVDDFMGWDFGSNSDESGFDNDPMPGHPHGTHVAGIIAAVRNNEKGIAGITNKVKIMPVKIGYDSQFSRTLVNGYDGVLYAAMNGAHVINCSWGGGGFSEAEQELIDAANTYGCVIVAAAGNNAVESSFYPAAYDGIISVASSTELDRRSGFSNYHSTVDISAPGTQIMSTIPIDLYTAWDGTSMASPVVAACAAVIRSMFPEYSNKEVAEVLKATSDNFYDKNTFFLGKLGAGRVNLFNAITKKDPKWVSLHSIEVIDEDGDDIVSPGNFISVNLTLSNYLADVDSVYIKAYAESYNAELLVDSIWVGTILKNSIVDAGQSLRLRIPDDIPINHRFNVRIHITRDGYFTNVNAIELMARPSWRTLKTNTLKATVTSQGNIAYNDFPHNQMGDGFAWNQSSGLLFEGALMIAADSTLVANVARGASGNNANRHFEIVESIEFVERNDQINHTFTEFTEKWDSLMVGVSVLNNAYIFNSDGLQDALVLNYDVINQSGLYRDSLFVAMYFDWDIGPGGSNNVAKWDFDNEFGYVQNIANESYPLAAVKMLNQGDHNFFAIDNDGTSEENPGVYDGFSMKEKWYMMSNGIARAESGAKDVSMVIGSGPLRVRPDDTVRVTFVIFANANYDALVNTSKNIKSLLPMKINPDGVFNSRPINAFINRIYPNPATGDQVNIEFAVTESDLITIDVIDITGKQVKDIISISGNKFSEYYLYSFSASELAIGKYFVRMTSGSTSNVYPFVIER